MQGRGRRLHDGQEVAPPSAMPSAFKTIVGAAVVVAMTTMCPSHDSFEAYLNAAGSHPSGWLGGLASVADRLRIAVSAETNSYIILRIGKFKERKFLGAFGTWFALPPLPLAPGDLGAWLPSLSYCVPGGMMPHEQLALLALLGFVVAINFPRFTRRHGFCSLDALRGGRLWTLVTSNFADGEPAHLLHNLLHLLHLGPVMHGALGCNKAAQLLLAIAIASSFASIFWNGVLGGRSHTPAVGGSGLVMGLVAANAALFPKVIVVMYGIELTASQLPVAYLLLDLFGAGFFGGRGPVAIDVSSHAGGAAAGGLLASRWRPWWL